MLKIHRTSGRTVVFTVSGQLDSDNVNELCQVVDAESAGGVLVLDLMDLQAVVERSARVVEPHAGVQDSWCVVGPTVLPVATGEMTARHERTFAPFHGVKLATTPKGRRAPIEWRPG
ncbi:MAG TPA: hypothetical protein VF962_00735 [Gemmatimonadaceae bacterium]